MPYPMAAIQAAVNWMANQGASDTIAPTLTISLVSFSADVASMQILASEEVTGFAVGDIAITAGGSLASFATADNIIFTVDWTLAAGANTMDIAAGVCQDAAGNDNTAATQFGIGAAQTATLKPDETVGVDAYIDASNANTNYATSNSLYVGEWSAAVSLQRSLIKFTELSGIAATALVKTATLKLYLSSDQSTTTRTLRVFRQLRAWVESQATWNIYSTGNNWGTAGGFNATDCEQTDIGSLEFSDAPTTGQYYSWVLTPSKVQEWTAGTFTNNGMLLKMDTEDADNLKFSSATDSSTKRPILEVVYRVPFSAPTGVQHVQLLDCPVAADQMGFEELNGLLYYVAGRSAATHSNKTYAYNPVDNTWTEKADYPIGCQSLILKAVGGKLYGIGGHDSTGQGTWYNDVYEYDPDANTWTAKTDMPTAREDFGAAVIGTKIYCFGGLALNYNPTKVLEIYDTELDSWDATKASMPDFKHFGDFGAASGGKIYAIGGSNSFADYPTILHQHPDVYQYDPDTNVWSKVAFLPISVSYKEAAVLSDNCIYIVSGVMTSGTDVTDTAWKYNPTTNAWSQLADAPYAAQGSGLAVYNDRIYMVGGNNDNNTKRAYLYRLGYA